MPHGRELSDAEVADVVRHEADDLGLRVVAARDDGVRACRDMHVLGRSHGRCHRFEVLLHQGHRQFGVRESGPHELLMPLCRLAVGFAARIDQRAAQLFENQRAPVQPDEPAVVEVNQQAARGGTEERIGVRNNGNHRDQRAKISLSRSSPSLPRARRRRACSRRCQASTADLSTLRWLPTC
jgi:hypothetical protein